MNYYEHHLGDYAEATAHLSFVEDAAYSRLIRKYYASELPLPAEIKSVQRLVGARTKDERGAVETVLKEFFELREDGWHNDRCDEEISKARARIEAARSNGRKGGRPPGGNNPVGSETVTQKEPGPSVPLTQVKALHTPSSIHQTPEELIQPSSLASTLVDTRASKPSEIANRQLSPEAAMAIPLREAGVKVTSIHPVLCAWVRDGYSLADVMGALAIAREAKGDVEIHAKYLDTIVRDESSRPKPRPNGSHAPSVPQKTVDEREDEIIVRCIREGLSDQQIVEVEDLAIAPNLPQRIRAKRQELTREQH